ncbi:MAG: TIGR00159 family protein [Desulfovibrio sp.]|nr:MAG: TIGR00159 family protein [Desulfovibrio sp.]
MFELFGVSLGWRDILDISIVTVILYRVILLVRGTRAVSVVYGLLLLVLFYFISEALGLYTLNWLLANFLGSIFLVVVILFQQDIRKALSVVGAGRFWRRDSVHEEVLNQLVAAMVALAKGRIGALVVIEKSVPLGDVTERGVVLGAKVSKDLLMTIFYPSTPLHDGAVIIKDDEITAAACILPLSTGMTHRSDLGTRHRAALGITEETDAVAVIVSEERGEMSVAINGRLTASLDEVRLKRVLRNAMER